MNNKTNPIQLVSLLEQLEQAFQYGMLKEFCELRLSAINEGLSNGSLYLSDLDAESHSDLCAFIAGYPLKTLSEKERYYLQKDRIQPYRNVPEHELLTQLVELVKVQLAKDNRTHKTIDRQIQKEVDAFIKMMRGLPHHPMLSIATEQLLANFISAYKHLAKRGIDKRIPDSNKLILAVSYQANTFSSVEKQNPQLYKEFTAIVSPWTCLIGVSKKC